MTLAVTLLLDWLAVVVFLLALLAVLWLIERVSGRCLADLVADWLGRESREDRDRARQVLAHQRDERLRRIAVERERMLAGYRPIRLVDPLEELVALPCAPNPRLRYVDGSLERRLADQRRREDAR